MRLPAYALLLPSLGACHHRPPQPAPLSVNCPVGPATQTPGWGAAELDAIRALYHLANREGAALTLRLDNGRAITLRDSVGDTVSSESAIRYRLVGLRRELLAYEVEIALWEGSATLLIDVKTGHRTYTWGSPVVAPNGRRFAALSYDLAAQYDPNGVQIWRTDQDTLALEWSTTLKEWGPTDARWLDSTTIVVRRNAEFEPIGDTITGCALIVRRRGQWLVQSPAP